MESRALGAVWVLLSGLRECVTRTDNKITTGGKGMERHHLQTSSSYVPDQMLRNTSGLSSWDRKLPIEVQVELWVEGRDKKP